MENQAIENQALAFLQEVCSSQDLLPTAQSIPEVFVNQVRQGYTSFFVNTDLVSDAAYMRGNGQNNNYLRIELRDAMLQGENEVSFKLKLSGILNAKNGQLTNMKPGGSMSPEEGWIKGFISNRVAISAEDVTEGLITEQDFQLLLKYAAWWQGVVETEGTAAPYKKYAKNRLWLAASNDQFLFQFQLEPRNNPTPKPGELEVVCGMKDMSWSNAHFTNTTPSLAIGRIGIAGGVQRAAQAPIAIARSFSPRVQPEETTVVATAPTTVGTAEPQTAAAQDFGTNLEF